MATRWIYAFSAILPIGVLAYVLSAQAAPAAPENLVLSPVEVNLNQLVTPGYGHAPVNIRRHFANPTLLGEVKTNLAELRKGASSKGGGGGHGKPTPTPSPSPSPSPSPTPTPVPSPVPISSGASAHPVTFSSPSFIGMNLYGGGGLIPPDTNVAAGTDSTYGTLIYEAVNSISTVYNSTGVGVSTLIPGACTTNTSIDSVSDPRVLFDSGHWFVSTTTFSPIGDASWNLTFSTTNDPNSTWYCLIIPTSTISNPDHSTGNFPDFPKMGINSDKIVLTGDAFSQTGPQSYKYQGTEFVVINKSDVLSTSGTVNVALYPPDQGDFAIEPAFQINSTKDPLYMAAVNSGLASTSSLDVWRITGVPGGNNLQITTRSLPIGTISYPPNARQAGTSEQLDTNDDSLLDAFFRESSGSLWVSANDACTPSSDTAVRSCLRFIKVSIAADGTPSIAQDFDYGDVGTDYYYPAVRTDDAGNLYASFSGSSGTTYPSAYAGVEASGNTNELTKLSVTHAGEVAYALTPPRWGDYSGATVDPGGASAWLGAEYSESFSIFGSIWGTAIAHVSP